MSTQNEQHGGQMMPINQNEVEILRLNDELEKTRFNEELEKTRGELEETEATLAAVRESVAELVIERDAANDALQAALEKIAQLNDSLQKCAENARAYEVRLERNNEAWNRLEARNEELKRAVTVKEDDCIKAGRLLDAERDSREVLAYDLAAVLKELEVMTGLRDKVQKDAAERERKLTEALQQRHVNHFDRWKNEQLWGIPTATTGAAILELREVAVICGIELGAIGVPECSTERPAWRYLSNL